MSAARLISPVSCSIGSGGSENAEQPETIGNLGALVAGPAAARGSAWGGGGNAKPITNPRDRFRRTLRGGRDHGLREGAMPRCQIPF